jgi:hypothetical protein
VTDVFLWDALVLAEQQAGLRARNRNFESSSLQHCVATNRSHGVRDKNVPPRKSFRPSETTNSTFLAFRPTLARRARAVRRRGRGRSDLLWAVAVGVGDYLHHVTIGVLEVDAATAVQMIDLAGLGTPRIGVIADAPSANAGERRVELGVADKERVMSRTKLFTRIID